MILTLEKLKLEVNTLLGVEIEVRCKKSNVSRARKVFCKIAKTLEFTYTQIKDVIPNFSHDVVFYHNKTFSSVTIKELHVYNYIIDTYSLPIQKIKSENHFLIDPVLKRINEKLSDLSVKEIRKFERDVLNKYILDLDTEKKSKMIG